MEQEQKINIEETSINLVYVKKELENNEPEFPENQYKIVSNFENISVENGYSFKEENKDLIQETIKKSELKIIQCYCCKVLFEEWEHLENHMLHCLDEKSNRLYDNKLDIQRKPAEDVKEFQENDEISTAIDDNRNREDHLKAHFNTHYNSKPFECDICKNKFTQKDHLKRHIRDQHSNTNEKEYKCNECSYQTNRKDHLKRHFNRHYNTKLFECVFCKKGFTQNCNLKTHIKDQHSDTNDKEYKCTECTYQTNSKYKFKAHLNTHYNIKPFECDICKKGFTLKDSLKTHMEVTHSNNEKYKCSECSYQTNRKDHLKIHLNIHNNIKPFECDFCKKTFTQKGNLKLHIMNMHSSTNEEKYKCTKSHLNRHNKTFECDICKKGYTRKHDLKVHIMNIHSNTNEKNFKCSECPYQTNVKSNLKVHLSKH